MIHYLQIVIGIRGDMVNSSIKRFDLIISFQKIFFKKLVRVIVLGIVFLFTFYLNPVFSNVIYDVDDIGMDNYLLNKTIEDLDLDIDCINGPGADIIKNELNTNDNYKILSYVDEHFEDSIKETKSNVIYTNSNTLKVGHSINSNDNINKIARNRKLDVIERIKSKVEEKLEAKEDKENKRAGNRVTIYIKSDARNTTNPVPGIPYKKNYTFYTECATLTELLNEKGITDDTDLINTIDGVTTIGTVDEGYSSDYAHGFWKGYYWTLYVDGKKSNVGADNVILEDGTRVKWVETYEEMSW